MNLQSAFPTGSSTNSRDHNDLGHRNNDSDAATLNIASRVVHRLVPPPISSGVPPSSNALPQAYNTAVSTPESSPRISPSTYYTPISTPETSPRILPLKPISSLPTPISSSIPEPIPPTSSLPSTIETSISVLSSIPESIPPPSPLLSTIEASVPVLSSIPEPIPPTSTLLSPIEINALAPILPPAPETSAPTPISPSEDGSFIHRWPYAFIRGRKSTSVQHTPSSESGNIPALRNLQRPQLYSSASDFLPSSNPSTLWRPAAPTSAMLTPDIIDVGDTALKSYEAIRLQYPSEFPVDFEESPSQPGPLQPQPHPFTVFSSEELERYFVVAIDAINALQLRRAAVEVDIGAILEHLLEKMSLHAKDEAILGVAGEEVRLIKEEFWHRNMSPDFPALESVRRIYSQHNPSVIEKYPILFEETTEILNRKDSYQKAAQKFLEDPSALKEQRLQISLASRR